MFRKIFSLRYCLFSMLVLVQSCAVLPVKKPHLIEKTAEVFQPSEIKTYTYEDALDLAEDSEGFYNFFLLPGISPDQAYAFEQKLAAEWGTGYNVFTGAHPYTVMALIDADVPVETLKLTLKSSWHIGKRKTIRQSIRLLGLLSDIMWSSIIPSGHQPTRKNMEAGFLLSRRMLRRLCLGFSSC